MNAPLHVIVSWDFSHKNEKYSHSTTRILAGSSTCRMLPVPQAEIHIERVKIIIMKMKVDLKVILKQAFKHCYEIGRNSGTGVL